MAFIGMVDRDEVFTTIEMKIHYLKPFTGGDLIAEASIIHKGSKIVLGDVEVRNGNGDLVAKGLATYLIMKKE
jgi:acyl-CoA thioesterase